ncbi:hypothetical protein NC653_009073 [Populus alba x Populus x berolinensis]|uniref:Uncharacterized protein n=1 Tax=Populus alba x Populus x berolinensis TaxID=444605 RepID=A0AAD6W9T1_9ROSI|nr:hypothetical protein NC653_009073 [Populus alba x Populus x berolinensis]
MGKISRDKEWQMRKIEMHHRLQKMQGFGGGYEARSMENDGKAIMLIDKPL